MRIIFATGNAGKIREIRDILKDVDAEVCSLKDLSLSSDIEETGETFAENAFIKASGLMEILSAGGGIRDDDVVMADDSGIMIDYLGGEPGVRSARFLGHDTPYSAKNAEILRLMRDVPDEERGARFICHITALLPDHRRFDLEDEMPGEIAREPRGREGFGYDPIFFLPWMGKTAGELSEDEKNKISHRGKVLRRMRDILISEGIIRRKFPAPGDLSRD